MHEAENVALGQLVGKIVARCCAPENRFQFIKIFIREEKLTIEKAEPMTW
jgi:hypothetical protein